MNKGVVIGIVLAVLVLGGIGGGLYMASRPKVLPGPAVKTNSTMPLPEASGSNTVEKVVESAGPVKEFTVIGSNFKFSLSDINVKKGDTVKIIFKSKGTLHDFKIDEFDVATNQLAEDEEEQVEFVADKAGTFEYYCSVGNHRQMGMVGKLVVQ